MVTRWHHKYALHKTVTRWNHIIIIIIISQTTTTIYTPDGIHDISATNVYIHNHCHITVTRWRYTIQQTVVTPLGVWHNTQREEEELRCRTTVFITPLRRSVADPWPEQAGTV